MDTYEVNFGVLPLDTPVTDAGVASESMLPSTPDEHSALLASAEIPPHVQPFFIPKLLREGKTVRLYQMRFDEQQKKFCYHVLAQPLREPTPTTVKPQLRLSCPNIDKKFETEDVLNFLRYNNIRSDGTYYAATPEAIPTGRGYGRHGEPSPTTERKLNNLNLFLLINNSRIKNGL